MQTISIPYTISDKDALIVASWRRQYSIAVRTAYRHAAAKNDKGEWIFKPEKDLRNFVKDRFDRDIRSTTQSPLIDAWFLHCATREAMSLRKARPDGRIIFGSKANLIRREKQLITEDEWRSMRLRPLMSLGDKSESGNRHFRLSPDGRSCELKIFGKAMKLSLPELNGKWGSLLPAVAKLASNKEINVTFRIGAKTLDITFDPMDLRKLPAGMTLQAAKDNELAATGKKSKGRSRGPNYIPPRLRGDDQRFVHPEWKDRIPGVSSRVLGIDLNPAWIGLSVVENELDPSVLADTKVLDHRLIKFDLDKDASDELVRETLAKVCGEIISLCRSWNCNHVTLEDGLGKLRSRGKNRSLNRLLNYWARTVFEQMLRRRCRLAGIKVSTVWCAYSTTIGNTAFNLPDACASAAEIARRGLFLRAGTKEGILPKYDTDLAVRRWKDEQTCQDFREVIKTVVNWVEYHKAVKTAKLGVRRPHETKRSLPESGEWLLDGYAVRRLGDKHRPGFIAKPMLASEFVRNVGIGVMVS